MGVFKPMLAMFMSYAHKCNIFFYILVPLTFYLPFYLIFINTPQIGMFCS